MGREEETQCLRCGACCLPGIFSLMRESDIRRWRVEKRDDILHIVEHYNPIWAGDHMISAQGSGTEMGCPFLEYRDGMLACAIYETRPEVCREFRPGSSRLCRLYEDSGK